MQKAVLTSQWRLTLALTALSVIGAGLAGCDRDSGIESRATQASSVTPGGASTDTAPEADPGPAVAPENLTPPADARYTRFLGVEGPKPARWIWHPPSNDMRTINWFVPGQAGGDMAELVVFHLPIDPGIQANIDRWTGLFRVSETELLVVPQVTELTIDGMPTTVVELAGEYMKPGAAWYVPDQQMIVAVIKGPDGTVYVRLTGESATVTATREAFMTFITGLTKSQA